MRKNYTYSQQANQATYLYQCSCSQSSLLPCLKYLSITPFVYFIFLFSTICVCLCMCTLFTFVCVLSSLPVDGAGALSITRTVPRT